MNSVGILKMAIVGRAYQIAIFVLNIKYHLKFSKLLI